MKLLPEGLCEITFRDFGIADDTYTTDVSGMYSGNSLDGTVFTGVIKAAPGAAVFIGGKTNWQGIKLIFTEKALSMMNGADEKTGFTKLTFDSTAAGTVFTGIDLKLQMSFEFVDNDGGGTENDLKLGMWFNGILYNNNYIYLNNYTDRDDTMGRNLQIYGPAGTVKVASRMELLEEYALADSWTDTDTAVTIPSVAAAYDVYYWGETSGYIYNETAVESVLETECYMTYTVEAFEGTSNKYALVGTSLPIDDYPYRKGKGIAYSGNYTGGINPLFEVGYTYYVKFTVADNDYTYTVVREMEGQREALVSQTQERTGETDVSPEHFGIYLMGDAVNAKLSNVRFWDKNGADLKVASNSSQAVLFDAGYKKGTTETYNLANGSYVITGTGPFIVTGDNVEIGKEYKAGDTLNQAGTYKIVNSYGLYTRNVTLYDGSEKSASISTAEHVMPIGGFYGPYRTTDKNGTYRDLVTDDIFQKIQDIGVNLIVASSASWSETGTSDVITKSLYLAEKYGIGVYVNDNSLLYRSDVVAELGLYSNFTSFKGLHLIDEPTTASYYGSGTSANTLRFYANAAKQLNRYTNLNAYINLYGMVQAWASASGKNVTEYYNTYLDEYLEATNASHLSYDTYAFIVGKSTYFTNLAVTRQKALDKGIPFWGFVQAGSNFNDAGEDLDTTGNNNTPTKGEFLWNVNTTLAYGAKGIEYFTLVQPAYYAYESSDDKYDYERNGLIAANGELTKWGSYAKEANAQIAAVDEVLMNATSVAVLAKGSALQSETGITATGYGTLASITIPTLQDQGITETGRGALIGVFDYRGKEAYYVVNNDTTGMQTVTLNFTKDVSYCKIQSAVKTSGATGNKKLELRDIPAGEAVLVVLE